MHIHSWSEFFAVLMNRRFWTFHKNSNYKTVPSSQTLFVNKTNMKLPLFHLLKRKSVDSSTVEKRNAYQYHCLLVVVTLPARHLSISAFSRSLSRWAPEKAGWSSLNAHTPWSTAMTQIGDIPAWYSRRTFITCIKPSNGQDKQHPVLAYYSPSGVLSSILRL